VLTAQQANIVIGRIAQRDIANEDLLASFQRNGFGPPALAAIAIDGAAAQDGDVLDILAPDQGEIKKTGFPVCCIGKIQFFIRIEICFVRAGLESGAVIQMERDMVLQAQGAGNINATRKIDRASALTAARIDRLLQAAGVIAPVVAFGTIAAHIKRAALAAERAQSGEEDTNAAQPLGLCHCQLLASS